MRARVCVCVTPTHIQGCFRASEAVTLLAGLIVSILLIKSLASGVTVSHSGDGNCDSGQFYRSHMHEDILVLLIGLSLNHVLRHKRPL